MEQLKKEIRVLLTSRYLTAYISLERCLQLPRCVCGDGEVSSEETRTTMFIEDRQAPQNYLSVI